MTRNSQPTAQELGIYIKEARQQKNLTQENLAELIGVSDRIVRDWEAGKVIPKPQNQRVLAEILDIPILLVDLSEQNALSFKQIEEQTNSLKRSLDRGNFTLVLATCERLIPQFEHYVSNKELDGLNLLMLLEYFKAHSISITQNDPGLAAESFRRMARYARELKNMDAVVLGRTYQAEMYRRMKKSKQALEIINKIEIDAGIDRMIQGNFFQLAGRLHASTHDYKNALLAFKKAEEMAGSTAMRTSDIYVCFNLCSVYEERAKTYLSQLKFDQGMKYIELAEYNIPAQAPRWKIAVQLTKGELYIHEAALRSQRGIANNANFVAGRNLVENGFKLAFAAGHERQMARARALPKYFAQRSTQLNDISNNFDIMLDAIAREGKSNTEDFK